MARDAPSRKDSSDVRTRSLTPILPVSDRLFGISFVCSMVLLMSSSNSEILTD